MTINSWDRRFLAVAMQVSHWSKDPSSKMGAVIANAEQRLVALGYNGFPKQVEDCQSRQYNKKVKYEIVVHAEANALLIAGSAAVGGTVYLCGPRPICARCAGILIQAGIKRAVAIRPPPCDETKTNHDPSQMNWAESGRLALQMFNEAEVEFEPVHKNLAIEETFIDLMKWAEGNKDEAVAGKLRDLHQLVCAASSFEMSPDFP
jgi:dCMP deaminase